VTTAVHGTVRLREVEEDDLPVFFEHQRDPETISMAAFPPRDWEAFMAHWAKIMGDDTLIARTILFDGQVAGNIGSFERDGEQEIGYMLGRDYWGKGIATRALSAFLRHVTTRPLHAHVAKHNVASMRVLEKNGFTLSREDKEFLPEEGVEGFVFELRST